MAARPLRHRDLLASEIGDGLERGRLRKHDGLCRGRGSFLSDIGELGFGRLREDRHGVGDVGAEIDAADIDGFQQRQAAREFMP